MEQRQFRVPRRCHAGEIARFEPDIAAAAEAAVAGIKRDLDFLRLPAEPFGQAPKKSIDYAVMERTDRAAVVPVDLGWSDVGSWNAVWEVLRARCRRQCRRPAPWSSTTAATAWRGRTTPSSPPWSGSKTSSW